METPARYPFALARTPVKSNLSDIALHSARIKLQPRADHGIFFQKQGIIL